MSGSITMKVSIEELDDDSYQICKKIGGFKWLIEMDSHKQNNTKYLYFEIDPNSRSKIWSCSASYSITLHAKPGYRDHVYKTTNPVDFTHRRSLDFVRKFKKWDEIIDERNGFLTERREVSITFEIEIVKCSGVYLPRKCFLPSKREGKADTVLKVNGGIIAVSGKLLAFNSPFIHQMIYGPLSKKIGKSEEDKKEWDYELPDIPYEAFKKLVEMVYMEDHNPSIPSIEEILILADQFDFADITRRCDQLLEGSMSLPPCKRISLAERFNLPLTMNTVPWMLYNLKEIDKLQAMEEYKNASNEVKKIVERRKEELVTKK